MNVNGRVVRNKARLVGKGYTQLEYRFQRYFWLSTTIKSNKNVSSICMSQKI